MVDPERQVAGEAEDVRRELAPLRAVAHDAGAPPTTSGAAIAWGISRRIGTSRGSDSGAGEELPREPLRRAPSR